MRDEAPHLAARTTEEDTMWKQLLVTTALTLSLGAAAVAQEAEGDQKQAEEAMQAAEQANQPEEKATDSAEQAAPAEGEEPAVAEEAAPAEGEEPAVAEEAEPMGTEPMTAQEGEPAEPMATEPPAGGDVATEMEPQLMPVEVSQLTVEELVDADVRNPDGETLGTIEDALLGEGGTIESLVVSFGGFLGFGERTVELSLDEVELLSDGAGTIIAETSLQPEDLEARPDYEAEPEA
jgi:hypothetical protein